MSPEPVKLVICGGGNGAQAWSGIASSQPNTEVHVLTLFQDEAQRWSDALQKGDFTVSLYEHGEKHGELKSKPTLVTKDPSKAIPGTDVIVFVMPAFAHENYLQAIKPYIEPGMILAGLPGRPGFEFQVYGTLGDVAKQCSVMNFETLPWATRITEYGRAADVLGTKETINGSVRVGSVPPKKDPQTTLQHLMGEKPVLNVEDDLISITMSSDSYLHQCIMMDRWIDWDGEPVVKKPLFYQGISQDCADVLTACSDEKLAVVEAIKKLSPKTGKTV